MSERKRLWGPPPVKSPLVSWIPSQPTPGSLAPANRWMQPQDPSFPTWPLDFLAPLPPTSTTLTTLTHLTGPLRLDPSSALASIWNPALGHPAPSPQARPVSLFCRPPNPQLPCLYSGRWPVQLAPIHLSAICHRQRPSANRQELVRAVARAHV